MKRDLWPMRDSVKDYFPLSKEIFSLGLSAAEIAIYAYLLFCGRHGVGGGFRTISTAALITLCCILGCSLLGTEAVTPSSVL